MKCICVEKEFIRILHDELVNITNELIVDNKFEYFN